MGTITPIEASPEPRKEDFEEKLLPQEPRSDVKLVMDSGMVLRERVKRVESDTGCSLVFTYTRLDNNDEVMLNDYGQPMISFPHEVVLIGEHVNRHTSKQLQEAIKEGRKVAAARAVDHFTGLEKMADIMTSRL